MKKWLSMLLTVMMLVNSVFTPIAALAEDSGDNGSVIVSTEEPADDPTEAPVEETKEPDPTAAPVGETEVPAEETKAPAEETKAPVEETEAPAEETKAPVEETEAPAEETEAPAEETEAPAEETEVPVEETEEPAPEETEAPEIEELTVALSADADFAFVGETVRVALSVAGGFGGVQVTWQVGGEEIGPKAVTDGSEVFDFAPEASGDYTITAVVTDEAEQVATANVEVIVAEHDTTSLAQWTARANGAKHTEDWRENIVAVAQSQVGYAQSTTDFILENGEKRFYSVYGDWFGQAYAEDWSAMFVSFSAAYAQIPTNGFPHAGTVSGLYSSLNGMGAIRSANDYEPEKGDIVFFRNGGVGIVVGVSDAQLQVIEGDREVARRSVARDNEITAYASMMALMLRASAVSGTMATEDETQDDAGLSTEGWLVAAGADSSIRWGILGNSEYSAAIGATISVSMNINNWRGSDSDAFSIWWNIADQTFASDDALLAYAATANWNTYLSNKKVTPGDSGFNATVPDAAGEYTLLVRIKEESVSSDQRTLLRTAKLTVFSLDDLEDIEITFSETRPLPAQIGVSEDYYLYENNFNIKNNIGTTYIDYYEVIVNEDGSTEKEYAFGPYRVYYGELGNSGSISYYWDEPGTYTLGVEVEDEYRTQTLEFTVEVVTPSAYDMQVEAAEAVNLTDDAARDLVAVASSQVGYEEGEDGYSVYADWYARQNGAEDESEASYNKDWNAMFVSFAAAYANVPASLIPMSATAQALQAHMKSLEAYVTVNGPATVAVDDLLIAPLTAGDLVFVTENGVLLVGIASAVSDGSVTAIMGDIDGKVVKQTYAISAIDGYGSLAMTDKPEAVIERGGELIKYDTLAAALADVQNGETVTLVTDVTSGPATVKSRHFTLDMNGHAITVKAGSNRVLDIENVPSTGKVVIKNGSFTGCVTSGTTNHILYLYGANTKFELENVKFISNTSAGSIVYMAGGGNAGYADVTFTNVTLDSNDAASTISVALYGKLTVNGGEITNNTAKQAGAICFSGAANASSVQKLDGVLIKGNTSTGATTPAAGGIVYNKASGKLTLEGTVIMNNTVNKGTKRAGGLYIGYAGVTVDGGAIYGNTADGGARNYDYANDVYVANNTKPVLPHSQAMTDLNGNKVAKETEFWCGQNDTYPTVTGIRSSGEYYLTVGAPGGGVEDPAAEIARTEEVDGTVYTLKIQYATLQDAVNDAPGTLLEDEPTVITLLRDVTENVVSTDRAYELDLGGHSVDGGATGRVMTISFTESGNRAQQIVRIKNGTLKNGVAAEGPSYDMGANNGGALYVGNYATVELESVTLTGNTAVQGAAIYSSGTDSDVVATGLTLSNNTVTGEGGAIVALKGSYRLNNVTFKANKTTADRSYVFSAPSTQNHANGERHVISGLSITDHKGFSVPVYVDRNSLSYTLDISNVTLTGNETTMAGGIYYITSDSQNSYFKLTGKNTISNNTVTGNGEYVAGAIVLQVGSGTNAISGTTISGNKVTSDSAYVSGGITLRGTKDLTVSDTRITGNEVCANGAAPTAKIAGGIVQTVSGTLYALTLKDVTISGNKVEAANATSDAAGGVVIESTKFTMDSASAIVHNTITASAKKFTANDVYIGSQRNATLIAASAMNGAGANYVWFDASTATAMDVSEIQNPTNTTKTFYLTAQPDGEVDRYVAQTTVTGSDGLYKSIAAAIAAGEPDAEGVTTVTFIAGDEALDDYLPGVKSFSDQTTEITKAVAIDANGRTVYLHNVLDEEGKAGGIDGVLFHVTGNGALSFVGGSKSTINGSILVENQSVVTIEAPVGETAITFASSALRDTDQAYVKVGGDYTSSKLSVTLPAEVLTELNLNKTPSNPDYATLGDKLDDYSVVIVENAKDIEEGKTYLSLANLELPGMTNPYVGIRYDSDGNIVAYNIAIKGVYMQMGYTGDEEGTYTNPAASFEQAVKFLKEARAAGEDWDTIYVIGNITVSGDTTLEPDADFNVKLVRYDADGRSDAKPLIAVTSGTLTLNGGKGGLTIDGASDVYTNCGSLIRVSGAAALIVNDGVTLQNNDVTETSGGLSYTWGGAIYIDGGSVTLNAGSTIQNCMATQGGGILVNGTLTMNEGSVIKGCTATTGHGGGVMVYSNGQFTMNGGEISQNRASRGGGVSLGDNTSLSASKVGASLNMYGGTIKSNRASYGGGMYIQCGHTGNVYGGNFLYNTATINSFAGGGIYVNGDHGVAERPADGVLNIFDVEITGNKAGQGGGYAGCGDSTTFLGNGTMIYGNTTLGGTKDDVTTSTSTGPSPRKNTPTSRLYEYMSDGTPYLWRVVGTGEYVASQDLLKDMNKRYFTDQEPQKRKGQGAVQIVGNQASSSIGGYGGGIASNGTVNFGSMPTYADFTVAKVWSNADEKPAEIAKINIWAVKVDADFAGLTTYETLTMDAAGNGSVSFHMDDSNTYTFVEEVVLASGRHLWSAVTGVPGLNAAQQSSLKASIEAAMADSKVTDWAFTDSSLSVLASNVASDGDNDYTVTNTLVSDLTVTKKVTGADGDKTKAFTFTIALTPAEDGVWTEEAYTLNTTAGTLTFTRQDDGTYLSEAFKLTDGQSLTVYGIPVGMTYTVTEKEANADRYKTTATGDKGTIGEQDTAAFVNHREPVVTPTPSPTPTEEPTPEVTPTEEPTPEVTPTEEPTPEVTPTEEPTPEVTPTEEPTPEVTPEVTETPAVTDTPAPVVQYTMLSGTKTWVDDSNAAGIRPDTIEVVLYANGVAQNNVPEWTNTDTDVWTYTFRQLPMTNAAGATIVYTVTETPVEHYTGTQNGLNFTNTIDEKEEVELIEVSGVKTWVDSDNENDTRPESITIQLLQNGKVIATKTVTAVDNWTYTFTDLPVSDGYGNEYTYTVREETVIGYYTVYDGMNVINVLLPERPSFDTDIPDGPVPRGLPDFSTYTDAELANMFLLLDYGVPLFGALIGTGREVTATPYVFGGVGLLAIALVVVLGRKKKER